MYSQHDLTLDVVILFVMAFIFLIITVFFVMMHILIDMPYSFVVFQIFISLIVLLVKIERFTYRAISMITYNFLSS